MYGAGSIGRGFIGALFSEIGYEVVFIDVNDDVIQLINQEKTYPQIIMNQEQPVHWIKNIRAVDGKDPEAVSNEIADADIMATALGASVLEKVSPVIAQGLMKRWNQDSSNTLDILICENLMDADVLLRQYLLAALPEDKHALFEQTIGLVETSIGRMVPPADPDLIPANLMIFFRLIKPLLKAQSLNTQKLFLMSLFIIIWNVNFMSTIWHM